MAILKAAPCCLLAALAACGAPLVDDSYQGPVLLALRGDFTGGSTELGDTHSTVRAGIFWNPAGAAAAASFLSLDEDVANDSVQPFPASIAWDFFQAPPAADLIAARAGAYAFGTPAYYLDDNGNGRLDPTEHVVGVLAHASILYVSAALAAADSPTGFAVPAGYHVISSPFPCGMPPPPPGTDTCAVDLGAACSEDSDCGSDVNAVCLTGQMPDWPGGYCSLRAVPGGCQPAGGQQSEAAMLSTPIYLKACARDGDCARSEYQCDYSAGACLPSRKVLMTLSDDPPPPAICGGGLPPPAPGGP